MPSLLKSLSTLFIIFFICDIAILYSISQTADINKPQVILLENVSSLYMNDRKILQTDPRPDQYGGCK